MFSFKTSWAPELDLFGQSWLGLPLSTVCSWFSLEMWRPLRLLLLCCALSGLDAQEPDQGAQTLPLTGASPSPVTIVVGVREAVTQSPQRDAPDRAPTAEPLEEEFDNQENVISQVSPDVRSYTLMNGGAEKKKEKSHDSTHP